MRRLRVVYRPEARIDLQNIFQIVRELSQNKSTAYGFYQRILDRCERIGSVPNGGRKRDDLEPGLRMVPFEHSAIIAYIVEDGKVRITNIFYGGRDFESFYLGFLANDDSVED